MQIYMNECPSLSASAVALGFFDGVHIGHRELIKKTLAEARLLSCDSVVYTFSSHPSFLLCKDNPVKTIYQNDTKISLLSSLGVDAAVLDDFSNVCTLTPSEFVERVLVSRLNAKAVVCGYNFRFGKGNTGDVDTLRSLASLYGIKVFVIPPVCAGGEPVSSNRIRTLIELGEVALAGLLLGEPYRISGRVVKGKHIGHDLGFPTANIEPHEDSVLLGRGVYYTKSICGGREYLSVTNVGVRPTVGDGRAQPVFETHLIDFIGDIYDKELVVHFYSFARAEHRFDSLDELKKALERDVVCAKKYFEKEDV